MTSAISFDNIRGESSEVDHECYFICDLDTHTKLYTHYYHEENEYLIVKFNEDESLSEIYDLGKNQRIKRVFENGSNVSVQCIGIDNDLPMHYCSVQKRYIIS